MARRRKIKSVTADRKVFKRTAQRTRKRNIIPPNSRGGIRL